MSTLKEISESKITVFLKPKEGLLLSFARDLITFSFLGLCIYISKDSNWWTFFTGSLFLFLFWTRITSLMKKSSTTFTSYQSAIEYIEKLDREAS